MSRRRGHSRMFTENRAGEGGGGGEPDEKERDDERGRKTYARSIVSKKLAALLPNPLQQQKYMYSRTCIKRHRIKRSPSIKGSVVLKIIVILTAIKRSPLLSGRGHPLLSPNELFLLS